MITYTGKSIVFIILISMGTSARGLIRAHCYLTSKHTTIITRAAKLLRKYGLMITQINDADVIITDSPDYARTAEQPTIYLEVRDCATLGKSNKDLVVKPHIKAIFKTYSLQPIALNNTRLANAYHFSLINKFTHIGKTRNDIIVPSSLSGKIKCVVCTYKHPLRRRFDELKRMPVDFVAQRPIDVFFVGKISYGEEGKKAHCYRSHRLAAVEAIRKISGIKTFMRGKPEKPLSYQEYIAAIKNSKIVVSPWGKGEFCYRDFEAMLTGAILIKPDTSFVQTQPHMYQNNITYIACKADFSDLGAIVKRVLAHYDDYLPMRKYARNLIVNYTLDDFAKNFVREVEAALHS